MPTNRFSYLPEGGLPQRTPWEDIERLNEKLCRVIKNPVSGSEALRKLAASEEVAARIAGANEAALTTAIKCRVPLVEFTSLLASFLARPASDGHLGEARCVGEPLRDLTCFALSVARDLATQNVTKAQKFFGTGRLTAERLAGLSVVCIENLSHRADNLLRLRDANDTHVWDLVLIGDRCSGSPAIEVAHTAVQLAMIRKQELSEASDPGKRLLE